MPTGINTMKEIISNLTGKKQTGKCLHCGNCCQIKDWKNDFESDGTLQFMKILGIDTNAFLKLCKDHNKCQHLEKDNRCNIYISRPKHCREFPRNEWEISRHNCKGFKFK